MSQPPSISKRDREHGMFPDELAWDRGEQAVPLFARWLSAPGAKQAIIDFIIKHRGGRFVKWHTPVYGGYNCCFHLELEDGHVAMRVPLPGRALFPDDKIRAEVTIMRYVSSRTTIPVPHIYHWGTASENPVHLGPFIIMDYVPHAGRLIDRLRNVSKNVKRRVLDSALSEDQLQAAYGQMAGIILQLDSLTMPKIGSLEHHGSSWDVRGRPMPQNLTDVARLGGCPEAVLLSAERTFSTSDEYYSSLADLHMAQFLFQHNQAVISDDDARDKYMARHLFRLLCKQGSISEALRLKDSGDDCTDEQFKLICDGLTPSNVLIDENGKVVAVIDWEFAYFGPSSMASAPPWWLLLKRPEDYHTGLHDWATKYPKYLHLFLKSLETLEEEESRKAKEPQSSESQMSWLTLDQKPLSCRMRDSWGSGSFWITWAARSSYGFDPVFWKYMDERFFGRNSKGGYEERLALLSGEDRRTMEWIVLNKMSETRRQVLLDWMPWKAQSYLREVIGQPRV